MSYTECFLVTTEWIIMEFISSKSHPQTSAPNISEHFFEEKTFSKNNFKNHDFWK